MMHPLNMTIYNVERDIRHQTIIMITYVAHISCYIYTYRDGIRHQFSRHGSVDLLTILVFHVLC